MAMTIYVQSSNELSFGEPATPAHYYTGTTNFANILDDMVKGNIPINTGTPFPVVWKSDNIDPNGAPWDPPSIPVYGDGDNPWRK